MTPISIEVGIKVYRMSFCDDFRLHFAGGCLVPPVRLLPCRALAVPFLSSGIVAPIARLVLEAWRTVVCHVLHKC